MEFVGLFGGWEVSLKRSVLESVIRLAGCLSYKSRAGNCQVFRGGRGGRGGGGAMGSGVSYELSAGVCRVFCRVERLSFKPFTGIYLIGGWVDSFC